jgi:hypothetical protein
MRRGAFVLLSALATVPHVDAQGWTCTTIQRGETAWSVAARMTGRADERHASSFQIVESDGGRVIPKSRYDRIRAGWLACVATETAPDVAGTPAVRDAVTASVEWSRVANVLREIDSPLFLAGLLAVAVAFLWSGCHEYLGERKRRLQLMQQFGERFVREFERPLLDRRVGPAPVRARLRAHTGSGRLDVWLAPNAGRRYPNLSDHRDNVVYDIVRVSQLLRDPSFVSATPYTQAEWVVIPFHFQDRAGQVGGP